LCTVLTSTSTIDFSSVIFGNSFWMLIHSIFRPLYDATTKAKMNSLCSIKLIIQILVGRLLHFSQTVSNNYVALGCSHFSRPQLHLVALLVLLSVSKEPHNRLLTLCIGNFLTSLSCHSSIAVINFL
jgi:hypothetical protein